MFLSLVHGARDQCHRGPDFGVRFGMLSGSSSSAIRSAVSSGLAAGWLFDANGSYDVVEFYCKLAVGGAPQPSIDERNLRSGGPLLQGGLNRPLPVKCRPNWQTIVKRCGPLRTPDGVRQAHRYPVAALRPSGDYGCSGQPDGWRVRVFVPVPCWMRGGWCHQRFR